MFQPNVTVDIFRGYDPNNPMPQRQPDVPQVQGFLRHHMKNGRFGFNQRVFWTNVIYFPLGTDIRSGYNSNLNVINPALADTVVIPDYPVDKVKTAFMCVMVQRAARGQDTSFLKAYLDKAGVTVQRVCCPDVPGQLHVTLTSPFECPCLDGQTFTINYNGNTGRWVGTVNTCTTTVTFTLQCSRPGTDVIGYDAWLQCGNDLPLPLILTAASSCNPLHVQFALVGQLPSCHCTVGNFAGSYADITL